MRDKLKKSRRAKNLSVMEMAKALQISASFYYKIEKGARNPTLGLAKAISDILGQPVEELFFDNELDDLSRNEHAASLDMTGTD